MLHADGFSGLNDIYRALGSDGDAVTHKRDLVRGQAGFHWWSDRVRPI